MDFVAIDVETANSDLSSICQVGIAIFRSGRLSDTWSSLVDPEDEFDGWNIAIHGIDENAVSGAPKWPEVAMHLGGHLNGNVVVCHTAFDRASTSDACSKYGLRDFDCRWLDSARVVRRAWPEKFGMKGYGLKNVAKHLKIEFQHHDALEDARACGEVLCHASTHTGLSLEQWFERIARPIDPSSATIAREGDVEGPLYGNVVVFTGQLSIPRREAADLAARAGCNVGSSVTKKTTLLVVGDQDLQKLAGKTLSSKHLQALQLISEGQQIRIIRESDFQRLVVSQPVEG